MAIPAASDEIIIGKLPSVGVLLLVAGVPLAVNPANVLAEVLNEFTTLSTRINVNLTKKVTDGVYSFSFAQISSALIADSSFFIVLSSGTTTIDTTPVGRFRVVADSISEENRIRQDEQRDFFAESFDTLKKDSGEKIELVGVEVKDLAKRTDDLFVPIRNSISDIEGSLSLIRRQGGV